MINILKEYITACTMSSKRNYSRYCFAVGKILNKLEPINSLLNACTLVMT